MHLEKLRIQNFKSLVDVVIEPGNINVLIGANGSGKSAFLEALSMLSAAVWERVEDVALRDRGGRLGVPAGVISSEFPSPKPLPETVKFTVHWRESSTAGFQYDVGLNTPKDQTPDNCWRFHGERLIKTGDYGGDPHVFERGEFDNAVEYRKNGEYERLPLALVLLNLILLSP